MDAKSCIIGRRSIRKFEGKAVPREVLEEIVSMAAYAPSWKNSQTARYIAITDPAVKERVVNEGLSIFPHNQEIVGGAPVLILLTTVDNRAGYERDGSFTTSKGTHWQSFDAGIAAEAFCLAAYEMGLGTVILGIYEEDKVKAAADVPEGQSVSALIALGYPAEEPKAPKRKETGELLSFR